MVSKGIDTSAASLWGSLAERRAQVLSELVLLFAQGNDPVKLAEEAVNLVVRATEAADVFVYLWDEDDERLVLRASTPGRHKAGVDELRLRLGEGITGWSALHLKPVTISSSPRSDPRFVEVGAIDELEFNSMLAVPIADERSQLRGVFALYSEKEAAFGDDEMTIAVEVGRLLASGLVRAEIIEDLGRQSATARFLIEFPASSTVSLVQCLQVATRKTLDLLDAEVCVIDYMSRSGGGSVLIVMGLRVGTGDSPRIWTTHSRNSAQAQIEQYCEGLEHVSVVLGMGASRGVLSCYRRPRFRPRELDRLSAISTQLAVLLEAVDLNSIASSFAARLLVSEDEIEAARVLEELGVDKPVVLGIVRVHGVRSAWETAQRQIEQSLGTALGTQSTVLFDGTSGIFIADAPGGQLAPELGRRLYLASKRLNEEIGLKATIGLGSVAATREHASTAISHARIALVWAEMKAKDDPISLISFADIRDTSRLPAIVGDISAQVVELTAQIEPLVQYDIRHGSQLVRTLSVLAKRGGSANGAAIELVVHRNTLRQRLQRIEQILSNDLENSTDWLLLALAARVAEERVAAVQRTAAR
jgi:hypothetical protein